MAEEKVKNNTGRSNRTKLIAIGAVLMAVILLSVAVYSYFQSKTEEEDSARIALMNSDATIDISDSIPTHPGEEEVVKVTVTNSENGKVCEVKQSYELTVESVYRNLPLEWKIYNDEACTEPVPTETFARGTFEANKEESKTFYIKIVWPSDKKDSSYMFEVDTLSISVSVDQTDGIDG